MTRPVIQFRLSRRYYRPHVRVVIGFMLIYQIYNILGNMYHTVNSVLSTQQQWGKW